MTCYVFFLFLSGPCILRSYPHYLHCVFILFSSITYFDPLSFLHSSTFSYFYLLLQLLYFKLPNPHRTMNFFPYLDMRVGLWYVTILTYVSTFDDLFDI